MSIRSQEIEAIAVDLIGIPGGRRQVSQDAVASIAQSMKTIGLRTPITVRQINDSGDVELITGGHRLAAAKSLNWDRIDCLVSDCDQVEAELWEISENLHRSDLTALERSEQISRWVELAKLRKPSAVMGGKGVRGGARQVARELGVDEKTVRIAGKVASLTDDAKDAARETGLNKNQAALLAATKVDPEKQADVIRLEHEKRSSPPSNFPQDDAERSIKWRRAFEKNWNSAPSSADREWARQFIDAPIMDSNWGGS